MSQLHQNDQRGLYETSPDARRIIDQAADEIAVLMAKAMAERDAKRSLAASEKEKSPRS